MSRTPLVVAGILIASSVGHRRVALITAATLVPAFPVIGLAGMVWWAARLRPRGAARSGHGPYVGVRLAHVTLVGLAAGLSTETCLRFCAESGPASARRQVGAVLRRSRMVGLAVAADEVQGELRPFFSAVAAGVRSGAPLDLVLRSHAEQQMAEQRARRVSAARQLPGKLAVPIALLLLPGFVLVVMGPTVITVTQRLLVPFGGGG